jgi:ketosteroid isomerase-like protein
LEEDRIKSIVLGNIIIIHQEEVYRNLNLRLKKFLEFLSRGDYSTLQDLAHDDRTCMNDFKTSITIVGDLS